ncbi:MAG TPA: hypothetical protein VFL94_10400 [Actinomycetales bacterium]|nr:hypothetical protein [Actinomycetales bacterium]
MGTERPGGLGHTRLPTARVWHEAPINVTMFETFDVFHGGICACGSVPRR